MLVIKDPKGVPAEVRFQDYSIAAGVRVTVKSRDTGIYPRQCNGWVERVYPVFVLVRTTAGYRVTIHLTDLICSFVCVAIHGKAKTSGREDRRADKALVSAGL